MSPTDRRAATARLEQSIARLPSRGEARFQGVVKLGDELAGGPQSFMFRDYVSGVPGTVRSAAERLLFAGLEHADGARIPAKDLARLSGWFEKVQQRSPHDADRFAAHLASTGTQGRYSALRDALKVIDQGKGVNMSFEIRRIAGARAALARSLGDGHRLPTGLTLSALSRFFGDVDQLSPKAFEKLEAALLVASPAQRQVRMNLLEQGLAANPNSLGKLALAAQLSAP